MTRKQALGLAGAAVVGSALGFGLVQGVVVPYRNEALAWRAPGMTGGPGSGADSLVIKIMTTVLSVLMVLL